MVKCEVELGRSDAPLDSWSSPRLFVTLLAAMASSLAWSVQVGYTTPEFLMLGMSPEAVGLAWLIGPISGIAVQPYIGVLSDQCRSRYGRRRPFIMFGALSTSIAMILFSQAARIGYVLGDGDDGPHTFGLIIAVIAFGMLDCSINLIMAPTRALVADLIPNNRQDDATAIICTHDGLGKAFGYFIGSVNLNGILSVLGHDLQIVYSLSALLIVGFCGTTFILARGDRPAGHYGTDQPATFSNPIRAAFMSYPRLPRRVQRAFIAQFFNTFAWFCFMVYGTDYFGRHINAGSPTALNNTAARIQYEQGIRYGNFALFTMSLSSALFARVLSPLIATIGLFPIYIATEVTLALCLFVMPFISSAPVAIALYAFLGVPYAATNTIPWMIVTNAIARTPDAGMYAATFNLSQCLPQIVVSLMSGPLLSHYNDNVAAVFVLGAFGAIIAAAFLAFISRDESTSIMAHYDPLECTT